MFEKQNSQQEFSVLLFDDDQEWAGTTQEYLKSMGIPRVDTAFTPDEASRRVDTTPYDVVLADVLISPARRFRKRPLQGDEWLLQHTDKLHKAHKFVVTAHPGQIRAYEELKRMNIPVIIKSQPEEGQLYHQIVQLAGLPEFARGVQEEEGNAEKEGKPMEYGKGLSADAEFYLGSKVALEAAALFLEWVRTRSAPQTPGTWFGGKQYSLSEIGEEVRNGSPLGNKVLSMFIRHTRIKLGLVKSPFEDIH